MNEQAVTIRKLIDSDNEHYRALWLHAITEYAAYFRVSPDDDTTRFIPTRFTADSFTIGAFFGTKLVGIVSIECELRKKINHKALVFRMFVHPEAAGRGVGRRLLQTVIDSMTTIEAIRYLYLTVLASNLRAIHLYSSLGFKEFAREPGAVNINGEYIDELQMALPIYH